MLQIADSGTYSIIEVRIHSLISCQLSIGLVIILEAIATIKSFSGIQQIIFPPSPTAK